MIDDISASTNIKFKILGKTRWPLRAYPEPI